MNEAMNQISQKHFLINCSSLTYSSETVQVVFIKRGALSFRQKRTFPPKADKMVFHFRTSLTLASSYTN